MRSIKQKHKSYLPALILTILFWLISGYIFFTIPPSSILIIEVFLTLSILSIFLTLSLILGSSKRGVFFTIGIIALTLLKKINQLTLLNIFLVLAILTTFSFLIKKSTK